MVMNLLKLRNKKGVSQEEVAAVLGVSRQAFSRYEKGEREMGYDSLVQLARYFDVSVDYLLGNSEYYYPDRLGAISGQEKTVEEMLIDNFRKLPVQSQEYVFGIVQNLASHV